MSVIKLFFPQVNWIFYTCHIWFYTFLGKSFHLPKCAFPVKEEQGGNRDKWALFFPWFSRTHVLYTHYNSSLNSFLGWRTNEMDVLFFPPCSISKFKQRYLVEGRIVAYTKVLFSGSFQDRDTWLIKDLFSIHGYSLRQWRFSSQRQPHRETSTFHFAYHLHSKRM